MVVIKLYKKDKITILLTFNEKTISRNKGLVITNVGHYYLVFVLSNGMDIKEYSKYISDIHNQQLWLILSSGCSFHQVYVSKAALHITL